MRLPPGKRWLPRTPRRRAGTLTRLAVPQQVDQLVGGQGVGGVGAFEEGVGQVALGVVELDDLLLDRVGGDEAVDRDRAGLADAVGAVGGLVLHRRVPPGVHVDHVVGGREVQAEAAGLERDQEQVALAILEGVDPLLAGLGRGRAVQVLVADALLVQVLAEQAQVVHELGEDQGLVLVFEQLVHQLGEGFELGAGQAAVRHDEPGVAAAAPQLHQFRQDLDVGLAGGHVPHAFEPLQGPLAEGFVQGPLFGTQFHQTHRLGARRQVFEHLRLGPPENEGLDEGLEDVAGVLVALDLDGPDEPLVEAFLGAEQAGIDEAEQIPELREPVFDGRARADHAKAAHQAHGGGGPLRGGVLDHLGLVQDDRGELHVLESIDFLLEQRVRADRRDRTAPGP